MIADQSITSVTRIEACVEDRGWPWAERNRDAVEACWDRARVEQPSLFDGRVFLFAEPRIEAGVVRAACFETRYANFFYWKRSGCPDPTVTNCFATAALRAADGAFLLGVMGPETANPGQVYFPAGTPEPLDRRADGTLDFEGNVARELAEETGLQPEDYAAGAEWLMVRDRALIAFVRVARLRGPADAMRLDILERMRRLDEQELSDLRIVRAARDIDARTMPGFIRIFLRWAFDRSGNALFASA